MLTKAKVTHPEGFSIFLRGVTDHYPLGTILNGELADKAIAAKRASRMLDKKKTKNLGAAPENKSE